MFKICNMCKVEKDVSEFYGNGVTAAGTPKYQPQCKPCRAIKTKIDKKDQLNSILEELNISLSCVLCGYNKNKAALCFHHLDEDDKDFRISGRNYTNRAKLKAEIEKCVILCHNCHMEHHHPEMELT